MDHTWAETENRIRNLVSRDQASRDLIRELEQERRRWLETSQRLNTMYQQERLRREALEETIEKVDEIAVERARLFDDPDLFAAGQKCRACDQRVQSYARRFASTWAACLLGIYASPEEWVHANDFRPPGVKGGDYAKMRYWGLIEPSRESEHHDPTKKDSGLWRLTHLGVQFCRDGLRIQRTVKVYNNVVQGYDGEFVTIHDVLDGSRFNYQDLMRGVV